MDDDGKDDRIASSEKGPGASGEYKVGYGKPPLETRFGAKRQPAPRKRGRKHDKPDIAALLGAPLNVKLNGRRTKIHPHEAMLYGLFKGVLASELRPIKEFLSLCKQAGLLEPPAAQVGGVIVVPKGVPADVASILIREVGLPPWDEETLAIYRAQHEADLAHIAKLKAAALARARANGENVY